MWQRCLFLFSIILAGLSAAPAAADDPESSARRLIDGARAASPPLVDGDIGDLVWKTAPTALGFYDRRAGGLAPDQTTARILYDERCIYVAFDCRDSRPNRITARETVRDHKYQGNGVTDNEDNVEVVFDTFLSRKEGDLSSFSVNAIGTPSAHISGGRAGKVEWKGSWDAAARKTETGWTAEMRVPWESLSYPSSKSPLKMGINFVRFQERTKIQSVWSNTGPQGFVNLMGTWSGVQVPADAFQPKLSLLPYLLPNTLRGDPGVRSGLDARYTITPELTAVATANPDFGTIEGAVEGIQFSRTERFVPERRPFFLEGEGFFQAGDFFAFGPYFYSTRIESLDLGAKVYGKITPADTLGLVHAVDARRRSDLVANYRHDFSPTSSAGFFFTQRSAVDDNNTVGVLLSNSRWGKFGIGTDLGISTGRDAGGGLKRANLTYSDKRLYSSVQFLDISPSFRDANGLIFFNDFRGLQVYEEWTSEWRKGLWRMLNVQVYPSWTWHADGRPFQRGLGADAIMETRSDWRFRIGTEYFHYDDQMDHTYTLVVRRGVSNRFRQWGLRLTTGRQANRPYTFVGPEMQFRVFSKLDLAYGGALVNIDGRTQQHILTTTYEFSPTRSIGGRIVVQDADTNWYVSFRSSGAAGTETYFIVGDPNARRFREFAALKFVFAI